MLSNAEVQVNRAQEACDLAMYAYEDLLDGPDAVDVAEYESALAVAEAELAEAQREYEMILAGPTQAEINAYEAQIKAAQASLDVVSITAPFDGIITQTIGGLWMRKEQS